MDIARDGRTATGVTYWDHRAGEEVTQPADLVVLAAYSLWNTHLMLISGIGEPYDPATGEGVTGRNYAYQIFGQTNLWFRDQQFNPFVGAGANGYAISDFSTNRIDFEAAGFIGGSYISCGQTNGQPIQNILLPRSIPDWGAGWKQGTKDWYGRAAVISSNGSNMAYRDCYLDLDPTYKDRHGRPLLRMTFDWKPNDIRMTQFMRSKIEPLAERMNPTLWESYYKQQGDRYDTRFYQSTHNVGGTIMGEDPKTSVLNRFQQTWSQHNVFATGAGAFPQNLEFNPTGTLGALAYWTADAIRNRYLRNPGPLV